MTLKVMMYLNNRSDKEFTFVISKGEVFESIDRQYQDLYCGKEVKDTIKPNGKKKIEIEVYCINPNQKPPQGNKYVLTAWEIVDKHSSQDDVQEAREKIWREILFEIDGPDDDEEIGGGPGYRDDKDTDDSPPISLLDRLGGILKGQW